MQSPVYFDDPGDEQQELHPIEATVDITGTLLIVRFSEDINLDTNNEKNSNFELAVVLPDTTTVYPDINAYTLSNTDEVTCSIGTLPTIGMPNIYEGLVCTLDYVEKTEAPIINALDTLTPLAEFGGFPVTNLSQAPHE